jgi:hypothetical protein
MAGGGEFVDGVGAAALLGGCRHGPAQDRRNGDRGETRNEGHQALSRLDANAWMKWMKVCPRVNRMLTGSKLVPCLRSS